MQVFDDEDATVFQQGKTPQNGSYDAARPVGAIIDDDVEPGLMAAAILRVDVAQQSPMTA